MPWDEARGGLVLRVFEPPATSTGQELFDVDRDHHAVFDRADDHRVAALDRDPGPGSRAQARRCAAGEVRDAINHDAHRVSGGIALDQLREAAAGHPLAIGRMPTMGTAMSRRSIASALDIGCGAAMLRSWRRQWRSWGSSAVHSGIGTDRPGKDSPERNDLTGYRAWRTRVELPFARPASIPASCHSATVNSGKFLTGRGME